ncbi:MAG: HRDC domain-containing protein, partial [Rickettsiales bacterium]|nr:HRDC domain-containing protein [Rickettsiales bacterium]
MTDYNFIDDNQSLADITKTLSNAKSICLDTEFVRDFSYIPNIGLIQINYENNIYLIDTVKCDIKPLLTILTNKNIVKIMHSATQDCDVLYRNFNIIPTPIFDTQIAATILGIGDNISYQKLVKKFTGKTLEKDTKLTNWSNRPLKAKQLNYAANDVRYLDIIADKLSLKLKDINRLELMEEETKLLYDLTKYNNDPLNAWQKISKTNKVPYFLNYLKYYAAIREEICKTENKLKRNLVSDEILVELAKLQPKSEEDLKQHRLLNHKLNKKLWSQFIAVADKVINLDEAEIKSDKKHLLNKNQEIIFNFLKLILNYFAGQNSIAPRILATSDELKQY